MNININQFCCGQISLVNIELQNIKQNSSLEDIGWNKAHNFFQKITSERSPKMFMLLKTVLKEHLKGIVF